MKERNTKYFAVFYLENNYFLPHFISVIDELKANSLPYAIAIPEEKARNTVGQNKITVDFCKKHSIDCFFLPCKGISCEYLFFGNTFHPSNITYKQTVSIFHGCWGGKKVYLRNELTDFDIRFVETEFIRENILRAHPDKKDNMVVVGYSKLDYILNSNEKDITALKKKYGFKDEKKTILYAPTFYPSSIRKIPANFPEMFSGYNIIVKPHFYIYMRKRYSKEYELIKKWDKYDNVYFAGLEENSLIPFMQVADVLVSDLSAAIYEFAAMDNPVVVNRFVKLRWFYKIMPNKLNKRLDIVNFALWKVGDNAHNYKQMVELINNNLENPDKNRENRQRLVNKVVGEVDGKVAHRIVKHLKDNIKKTNT